MTSKHNVSNGRASGQGGENPKFSVNSVLGIKPRRHIHKKKQVKPDEMNITDLDYEVDFETMVQREYQRLHRQYRLMENNTSRITGEGNSLSKQHRLLEFFRAEEENIASMLFNATCQKYQNQDREIIKTILQILEDFETLQSEINLSLRDTTEMESNVDKITKKLVQQKLKVQALYGRAMTLPQAIKKKNTLENRLYYYTTQYDTKISLNKELRKEINVMLRLRGLFHERIVTFKKQSNQVRRSMGEVVYLSNQAYDERDDAVARIHLLRDKNDRDTKLHINEIKDFKRTLNNDLKGIYFSSVKNQQRAVMESDANRLERKNMAKFAEQDKLLYAYIKSIKDVLSTSNHATLEQLVNYYGAHEQDNFSKFRYITDLNSKVGVLQDETIRMAQNIDQLYLHSKIEIENWKQEIENLEDIITGLRKEHANMADKLKHLELRLNEILHILESIFTVSDCPSSSLQRLLGNYTTITKSNAIICMKIIEQVTEQMAQEIAILELRKTIEIDNLPVPLALKHIKSTKLQNQGGPFYPTILVTGRLDGEEEEDEETDKEFDNSVIPYPILLQFVRRRFRRIILKIETSKSLVKLELSAAQSGISRKISSKMIYSKQKW